MRALRTGLFCIVLLGGAASLRAQQFAGLERLYFEPSPAPWSQRWCSESLGVLLPEWLPDAGEEASSELPDGSCDEFEVEDVALPAETNESVGHGALTIRQVLNMNHPRIHDQYWCLYADGRRADCWFFSPLPTRNDDKLLNVLVIREALARSRSELLLRVKGTMMRPSGGWWERGVELRFEAGPGELRYRRALAEYTFIQPYERAALSTDVDVEPQGDEDAVMVLPAPYVAVETLEHAGGQAAARIVRRAVGKVTPELSARCGIADVREAAPDYDDMRAFARCVTRDASAVETRRALDTPAFFERGGSATADD